MARHALSILVVAAVTLAAGEQLCAGPICPPLPVSLSSERDRSDATVLVQFVSAEPPDEQHGLLGRTTYEIVDIASGDPEQFPNGMQITLDGHQPAEFGDLFLLMHEQRGGLFWSMPAPCSIDAFHYVCCAPHVDVHPTLRMRYFLKFLEYPDPLIAKDAHLECAESQFQDLLPLTGVMPRELLRKWIADPATRADRLALYGTLLGICGQAEDAEFLRQRILEPTEEFRLGIDGIMIGYLLLTGERGLAVIEEAKLRPADVLFSEMYAAMQALRFLWREAPGCIEPDRLLAAIRLLLDRPDVVDLVILDLTRWHDWSVTDRLMAMYDAPAFDVPSVKRAIARYLLNQRHVELHSNGPDSLEHVRVVDQYLHDLRRRDPETVKQAERFHFIR